MDISRRFPPITGIPDHFLAAIGLVMTYHAFMDNRLQRSIFQFAGIDGATGVSFLSKVQATSTRAEIFKNLARTKEPNLVRLAKMLVLGDVVAKLCEERNIVAHTLPSSYSPSKDELVYFKDVNMTVPQIRVQPPYLATVASLTDLAGRLGEAGIWLGMLLPNWSSDNKAPFENLAPHPDWDEDGKFPWSAALKAKMESESKKPQNHHRMGDT